VDSARERFVYVETFAEASRAVRDYIAKNELGAGNWVGGNLSEVGTGQPLGRVSYNGRVWDACGREIDLTTGLLREFGACRACGSPGTRDDWMAGPDGRAVAVPLCGTCTTTDVRRRAAEGK
jgi:hypothetical protein